MKLTTLLTLTSCAVIAAAQRSFIRSPPSGANIVHGRRFTVQVIRPNSIQGSTEVGMIIGLVSCAAEPNDGVCPPPEEQVGRVLFNGDFNPALHEIPGEPYQNFTVTVPNDFPLGLAQLSTGRFHLIGAGPSPVLELNNVTVNVV
ncbi:hypothetical protein CPC08DRAFT_159089 [Agrocybe pediades]|nr:hypothetical protein CPC08DRAFT_159089 [Agrocybe pediades]